MTPPPTAPSARTGSVPERGAVDVWTVRSAVSESTPTDVLAYPPSCLSHDEILRLERLHPGPARMRFAATRVALRSILAAYTGLEPGRITIAAAPGGKPFLADMPDLHFSVSHSRDLALIAVSTRPVGVDVEQHRRPRYLDRIAQRLLHEQTCALLLSMPAEQRVAAFLDAWTQREAHVKAVGGGLFRTPDVLPFVPSDADGATRDRPRTVLDRNSAAEWSIARFVPADGYRAALVVRGRIRELQHLEWKGAPAS